MRNAFADEVTQLSKENDNIVLLAGDIGNKLFDKFKAQFPHRFFNCGVAEANMTSVAAGIASTGLQPITYTIAAFNTIRCLEQIKIDVCYHSLPVIIVGVGAGLSYANLSGSHHSCEDLSFLRSIPNMTVLAPADAFEVRALLREAVKLKKPVYMRMGKKGEPLVHKEIPSLKIGKAYLLQEGKNICIFATGNLVKTALEVGSLLEKEGVSSQIFSMHTIKPLDTDSLLKSFSTFPFVVSIEEHSELGGLGSSIAEWMVDHQIKTPLWRFATKDIFPASIGSQEFLRNYHGLTTEEIAKAILYKRKNYDKN